MSGAPSDLLRIARVLKSYGTEGEILVGFRDRNPEDLNLKEPVFIIFDGLPVPFFIESFKGKGSSKALLRLTGVSDLADAEELVGSEILASRSSLSGEDDEDGELSLDDFIGWSLRDGDGNLIGEITDYEPIPGNPCLYIETPGNGTVMIPLHEDFIVDIDEEDRILVLDLPEGLI